MKLVFVFGLAVLVIFALASEVKSQDEEEKSDEESDDSKTEDSPESEDETSEEKGSSDEESSTESGGVFDIEKLIDDYFGSGSDESSGSDNAEEVDQGDGSEDNKSGDE